MLDKIKTVPVLELTDAFHQLAQILLQEKCELENDTDRHSVHMCDTEIKSRKNLIKACEFLAAFAELRAGRL
jgi:hypothetical protein